MSNVVKSNPFTNVDGLIDALEKAPQDKEGAFRVATWLMVLKEIQSLKLHVEKTQIVVSETKNKIDNQNTPTLDEIKSQVKAELQSDLASKDADVILF